jgi:hypothetical protein
MPKNLDFHLNEITIEGSQIKQLVIGEFGILVHLSNGETIKLDAESSYDLPFISGQQYQKGEWK